jgi:predicted HTH transcriptional regulator
MPETQNIEYKSVWKDEYLKWICGFANAQGGTIFIGKDNNGNIEKLKPIATCRKFRQVQAVRIFRTTDSVTNMEKGGRQ